MIRLLARALLALLVCAFATILSAQEGLRDRDPNLAITRKIASDLQSAAIHDGPFYIISRLQLADIGYDQHFFVPTDSPKGLKWAVSAPQRFYFVPTRKVVASVEFAPSLALVHDGGLQHQFGYTSRADLQFIFNHVWLDLHTDLMNDLRAKTGEINSVVTQKELNLGAQGEVKYSSRTSATYKADWTRTRFPTSRLQPSELVDLLPLLERSESDYRVAVKHATFPLTTITVAGEASKYTFDRTASRDAKRAYAAIGADYDNGPTSARIEVGDEHLDFQDPAQHDFRGALGNATFNRAFGARTVLTLNAVRDIDFSIYLNNNFYVADRVGGTIDYAASRRLTLRLLSQNGRDRYKTPVNGILRRDSISFNGVGWSYSRRHLQGGFDVGYYERTSNIHLDESHGIRLLIHLSLAL